LALLSTAAVLAPAAAADLSIAPIYKAPPPAPVTTWSGSYLGVSGGGAWGKAVVRNELTGADQTPRMDLSGGIIGLTSGFNIQTGPVVLGLEGDISATNKKGSAAEFPPNAVFNNEVKERWLSTFRGRVGYAQDNWLLYATGGAALANVENTIVSAPGGQISDKQWHWGWTAGGGVEVKLTQDWTAKVEYLYVGLQDKSYFNPAPSLAFPSSQRLNLSDHIVRVGVNYKLPWNILDGFFKR
jgi:outer membrane immunogenic protein